MKIIIFQNKDISRTFTFVECYFENLWFVDILTSSLAIMVIIYHLLPQNKSKNKNQEFSIVVVINSFHTQKTYRHTPSGYTVFSLH